MKNEDQAEEFFKWCEKYHPLKRFWEAGNITAQHNPQNENFPYDYFRGLAKAKIVELLKEESTAPQWRPVSEFREHPHGEYLCVLKQDDKNHKPMNDEPPYIVKCQFTYKNGGKILRKGEDYTDRVEWFIINRTTLLHI